MSWWGNGRKYGNKKVVREGVTYDSRKENRYALQLDLMKRGGLIKDYSLKPSYTFIVNGQVICRHRPDFLVTLPDGTQEIHEIKGGKGTITRDFLLKKKLFEALYPTIKYVIVDS